MLENVGLRYPHRASGTKKPLALCDRCPCFGSLYPPPAALTFAAQSIICAFVSSRRTSLAVSALKIVRYCLKFKFSNHCLSLNIDPIYKTGALWQQRRFFVVAGRGRYPQSACLTKP